MPQDESEADTRPGTGARIAEDRSSFTALANDFYRGEVDRATTWRARLDQTTNWAVVLVAAILTWAFSGESHPHYVVLIGAFGVTAFLLMEANRYREYDVWRDRVRMLQADLYADAFSPGSARDPDWRENLSRDLREPELDISFREALNHRLRRSYLALLLILLLAWIARITVYEPQESWRETASILVLPGDVVVVAVAAFYTVVIALTAWSARSDRIREFQE